MTELVSVIDQAFLVITDMNFWENICRCTYWHLQFPLWFSEGKTTLIAKPGEFRSDNQRPITCLNNLYKWYTSCLLAQANQHIETYGLIQREQRGARGNCSGTVDNLLIDRMVCEDAQRGKRNLSMAWIDVAKAYDSVDHGWLSEMFTSHRGRECTECLLYSSMSKIC